jgi:putative transposase
MSYISIWLHCVWTTKNHKPFLSDRIRPEIIDHIFENSLVKGIHLNQLNGYLDHLHALISLGGTQNISEIMRNIKGESSWWINRNKLTVRRFEWQDDYYCVSVDYSHMKNLVKYIQNQEVHHAKAKLDEELKILIEENGLERFTD